MDKSLAGLLAVASVLAIPAQAATALPLTIGDAMQASSYADLLKPIPNALALLKASSAEPATMAPAESNAEGQASVLEVQYWRHHHHHHHHRHWYRRRWHHHHHHHHNT